MIRQIDDSVLREIAKPVNIMATEIQELLNDMVETMEYNHGIGLEAPQIGISLRLIVLKVENVTYKLINPEIISSMGKQNSQEGCLSLSDRSGIVRRPERVVVKALNEFGEEIEIIGRFLLACCLSHEIDHLNGVLFIDKLKLDT